MSAMLESFVYESLNMIRRKVIRYFAMASEFSQYEEGTRKYWNHIGDWYVKYNLENSNKMYKAMAPFLKLENAKSVIDAGCGAGNGAQVLQSYAPNANFTLVDISDDLVTKAQGLNLPRTQVRRENAEFLTDPDGTFDVYISNGLLEIVDNPSWLIHEAYRVLKPEGTAAFSIYGRMGICNTLRIYKSIKMKLKLRKGISEPRFELSDPEKAKALIKDAGFRDIKYFYEQYHFPSLEPKDVFGLYWENPVLREGAEQEGKTKELEKAILEELEDILYEKEEPLIYEALILTGSK